MKYKQKTATIFKKRHLTPQKIILYKHWRQYSGSRYNVPRLQRLHV